MIDNSYFIKVTYDVHTDFEFVKDVYMYIIGKEEPNISRREVRLVKEDLHGHKKDGCCRHA